MVHLQAKGKGGACDQPKALIVIMQKRRVKGLNAVIAPFSSALILFLIFGQILYIKYCDQSLLAPSYIETPSTYMFPLTIV
jgi:hypothetical protein